MAGNAIKKVGWWHEQIVDWMMTNPDRPLRECAEYFGVTQSWLSQVINSDPFQEFLANCQEAHRARLSMTVMQKLETLADMSLDEMIKRIESQAADLEMRDLNSTAKLSVSALGYGPPKGGRGPTIDARGGNVLVVDKETLQRARDRVLNRGREDSDDVIAELPAPS